jgi:6-phosphogluconolactonase
VGGAPQTFTASGGEDARTFTARTSNAACATVSSGTGKPPKGDEERDTRHYQGEGDAVSATFTVTPVGPGTCTITVTGNHGKDDSATVAVQVVGALVEFAYAVNFSSNTISAYAVNATSGALTPVAGSPFATGANPDSIAVDPSGKFAYVTSNGEPNSGSIFIYGYTINATSGALIPIAGSPFSGGPNPTAVTVDPTGKFAFVTNQGDGTVSAFRINVTSGALAPVVGSPYAVGTNPQGVAATIKFAYVANIADSTVSAFAIDGSSGALTPVPGSPFAAGGGPGVAADPTGKFA